MMAAQSSTVTDPVAAQIAAELSLQVAAEMEKSLKSEKVVTASQATTLGVLQQIQSDIAKLGDIDISLEDLDQLALIKQKIEDVKTTWEDIPGDLQVEFQKLLDQANSRYDNAKAWWLASWVKNFVENPAMTLSDMLGNILPRISKGFADIIFGVVTGVDLFTVHLADEMTDALDQIKQAAARRELAEVQASQLTANQQFILFKQSIKNLSGVSIPTFAQFRQQQRQAITNAVSTIMNTLGSHIAQRVEQPSGGTGSFVDQISPWKELNKIAGNDIIVLQSLQQQMIAARNDFLTTGSQASLQLMRQLRNQMIVRFLVVLSKLTFVTIRNVYQTIVQPVVERAIQLVREAFRALGNLIARFGPVAAKLGFKAILLPVDFAAWKFLNKANEKHAERLVKKGKDPTKITLAGDKLRFFANRIGIETDKGTVLFFAVTTIGATLLIGLPLGWALYRSIENRVQNRDIIKKLERAKELGIADRIEISLDDL